MVVCIVGLGLMGGSFGKALRKLDYINEIVGYDHNASHQKEALELKLVDKIVSLDEVYLSDIIILAIPVDSIIEFMMRIPPLKPHQLIMDLGSTKSKIVSNTPAMLRKNFVPSHPMTGTEKFGPSAAIEELYQGKIVVICDSHHNGETQNKLAIQIYTDLGMKIVFMPSDEHDLHAAFISHMPHIVSFSLANSVMEQEQAQSILTLAAGGFRDMSRIAKSSPLMWRDISYQNKDNLLKAMDYFRHEIDKAYAMIQEDQFDALQAWMQQANNLHEILK